MAYIQPDATILICQDVPLNASYDDTITFYNNAGEWDYQAQYNYFAGKTTTAMTKEKYSVVRERQGLLRVEGDVSHWQKVNYMVFTNKNFGGKHFYAFINKAEYVNPNTTFLHFQIDVLQTWLGDLKFETCYIDREHVEDDSLYANRESEGIEIQERLGYDTPFNFEPYIGQKMLVIGSTENPLDIETQTQIVYYNPFTKFPGLAIFSGVDKWSIDNGKPKYTTSGTNYFTIPLTDETTGEPIKEFTFNVSGVLKNVPVLNVIGSIGVKAVYNEDKFKWEFKEAPLLKDEVVENE